MYGYRRRVWKTGRFKQTAAAGHDHAEEFGRATDYGGREWSESGYFRGPENYRAVGAGNR